MNPVNYCISNTSLLILSLFMKMFLCTELDLTVDIGPGKQECFFQTLPITTDVELDYQVIDGGDLDINLMISGPDSRIYHVDSRKNENTVKFKTGAPGDYKICFDNTFSMISNKVVFFEMFVDDDAGDGFNDDKLTFEGEDLEDKIDMTVKDFMTILDRAHVNLQRTVQVQTLIRIHEAKDRNTQESNFWRVNFLSGLQLCVMIAVALVQVAMIRQLFADRKPVSGMGVKART